MVLRAWRESELIFVAWSKKKKNSCVTHPVPSQTFLALSSRAVSRDREKKRLLAVYNSFSYEDKQNNRYIHHLILNWDVLKRAKRPRLENVPRAVKQGKWRSCAIKTTRTSLEFSSFNWNLLLRGYMERVFFNTRYWLFTMIYRE